MKSLWIALIKAAALVTLARSTECEKLNMTLSDAHNNGAHSAKDSSATLSFDDFAVKMVFLLTLLAIYTLLAVVYNRTRRRASEMQVNATTHNNQLACKRMYENDRTLYNSHLYRQIQPFDCHCYRDIVSNNQDIQQSVTTSRDINSLQGREMFVTCSRPVILPPYELETAGTNTSPPPYS